MGSRDGHVELDRAVESIHVGHRHRLDLGDLDELIASISELGLLQPITISPDGTLICGARRLEAVKRLGWRQVNVWVRSGISTRLQRLLAEQHENTMRKPFTPTEAATLYRELRTLIAEDAARRQEATRFGGDNDDNDSESPGGDGGANLAPPSDRKSRAQAAQLVTGRKSYTTLERIGELERVAADSSAPEEVRELAAEGLAGIDADGRVAGRYQQVKAALDSDGASRQDELAALAQDALARVHAKSRRQRSHHRSPAKQQVPARRYGARAFVLTWGELDGWAEHYDPAEIGPALTAEQWAAFETTVAATVKFADAARLARGA